MPRGIMLNEFIQFLIEVENDDNSHYQNDTVEKRPEKLSNQIDVQTLE
jgi:hypothetical protein